MYTLEIRLTGAGTQVSQYYLKMLCEGAIGTSTEQVQPYELFNRHAPHVNAYFKIWENSLFFPAITLRGTIININIEKYAGLMRQQSLFQIQE